MHDEEWDGVERRKSQLDGFAINSWPSLMSLMSICLMAIGGISWGLKLESRIDKYSELQSSMRERFLADLASTQAIVSRGMLPVTEVKIQAIEDRLDKIDAELDQCVKKSKTKALYPVTQSGVTITERSDHAQD